MGTAIELPKEVHAKGDTFHGKNTEHDFDGAKSTHFLFKLAGTELVFEDDVLKMFTVRTQPDGRDDNFGLYLRPAMLVDGISSTATRAEVAELLGNPERVGPNFDRYEVNEHYLHFEFGSNDRFARISALLEAI
ncbi:hypothetical protein [Amycolatopsis sp. cmx-11-51]|uniref:hypothetical protein n=1 Tax=Amycolatopsis sp. cmx-11-51 TaxID=2785797 RepID=UPI0039E317AC